MSGNNIPLYFFLDDFYVIKIIGIYGRKNLKEIFRNVLTNQTGYAIL